jgi:hypothetical protein
VPATPRLVRVAALQAEDVAQMRRLVELAARPDLSRAERAVLDARFVDRVRAIDARAHGARIPATAGILELTAGGLGLEHASLASRADAVAARGAVAAAAAALAAIGRQPAAPTAAAR